MRDYWRGEPETLAEFASRLTGSADLYENDGRRPYASINFVTAHDGFTMHDLVSYNDKHNEANGEGGNDGESHNSCWNCGVEGDTDDLEVIALREQQKRNFLATLFLSQGVPMLLHGDELGRTQGGNNNVYAQDNEIAWVDWERAKDFEVLTEFVSRLTELRQRAPGLPPPPALPRAAGARHRHRGHRLVHPGRRGDERGRLGVGLRQVGHRLPQRRGHPRAGRRAASASPTTRSSCVFNGHHEPIDFTLPDLGAGERWQVEIDTAAPMLGDVETADGQDRRGVRGRGPLGAGPAEGLLGARTCPPPARPVPVSHLPRAAAPARRRPPGLRLRRRGRGRARTSPTSASRTCTARRTCRPRPARRTATTWSTTAG